MGSQAGATPSSSSSISTPAQSSQPQAFAPTPTQQGSNMTPYGGNVSAGFGGMNGQSMQNQQTGSNFQPPQQPWQSMQFNPFQQEPYGQQGDPFQALRSFMSRKPADAQPTPQPATGANPVLEQQQQQFAEQARSVQEDLYRRRAQETDKLNQNFYSWGGRGF